jgi:hypothetical protein
MTPHRSRHAPGARRFLAAACAAAAFGAAALATGPVHAAPGCESVSGVQACQNLGPFLASAVRVGISRKDGPTAYVGVRTTVRFQNVSDRPLILAYRVGSQKVTDDAGLVYNWNRGSYELKAISGIGFVTRDGADPQFVLRPGEAREASFEGVLQYSMRRQVPGTVYTHDLTIVELEVASSRQVRMVRDHAVSFPGLRAGAAGGAAPAAAFGAEVANGAMPSTGNAGGAQPADVAVKLIELFKQRR